MDRHAAIGRTPLRSRVHAGVDPAVAPHRPESRRIGQYLVVARGGELLHPVVVAADRASVPLLAVGHVQQPELRTGGQPRGEQAPVAGHRDLGGMGQPGPARRPLAVAVGAGRAHLHLIGPVRHQVRDARDGDGQVLRTVEEAPAAALAVSHIVAGDGDIRRRRPAHVEARRAPLGRRHPGRRQGAPHDDGVDQRRAAVPGRDLHLDGGLGVDKVHLVPVGHRRPRPRAPRRRRPGRRRGHCPG